MVLFKRVGLSLICLFINISLYAQIHEFPHPEGFENTFATGSDTFFITNWQGSEIASSNRIYQGNDPRTGETSLNIIPTTSFTANIEILLDLTGISNPTISFYAFSKQNGSASSTRPAILSFSTSTDGGLTFSGKQQIGDENTFPNSDSTNYKAYAYDLPEIASGQSNVIVRMEVARGTGSGSSAELVMDDFLIEAQVKPLGIAGLLAKSSDSLALTFNEGVTKVSAETIENYSIDNSIVIIKAWQTDANEVTLLLNQSLVNNTYAVTARNIENASNGEIVEELQAVIRYEVRTNTRDIVINEIFADPVGDYQPDSVVLPNDSRAEFIELYNTSENAIDITGFELSGGKVDSLILETKGYVILTATANKEVYKSFGNVAGVTSWNTLTNTGEPVVLKDNLGYVVDSLQYDLTWYKDGEKENGSWSIEQINPEKICSDADNWSASIADIGASPGKVNSNFSIAPDTISPSVERIIAESEQQITIHFNELMDRQSLAIAQYTISNDLQVSSIIIDSANTRSVIINLASPLVSGQHYLLSISEATDCAGNELAQNQVNFLFDNQGPVVTRVILRDSITIDLLFDEAIEKGSAEDNSNYKIQTHTAHQARLSSTPINRVRLSLSKPLQPDSSYQLVYEHIADTLGNIRESGTFDFQFQNQLDTAIVVTGQLVDLIFKTPLDQASAERIDNYTLNDASDQLKAISLDSEDKKTVHLILDRNLPDNEPLVLSFDNLQDTLMNSIQALNTIILYDTDDPDLDSLIVLNDSSIQVYFDEVLNVTAAESINNYRLNDTINPSKAILTQHKNSVVLLFSTPLQEEQTFKLTYTGIEDLSGNRIQTNRNYNFTYDLIPPRLLGLQVASPKKLTLTFSEALDSLTAEDPSNYYINNGIENPSSATLSKRNLNVVKLAFDGFGNHKVNTIQISNLRDLQGNKLVSMLVDSFSSKEPVLSAIEVLDGKHIQLQFSKALSATSASKIENYDVDQRLSISSIRQEETNGSIVVMSFENMMNQNSPYRLSLMSLEDIDGNLMVADSAIFSYDNPIENVQLLTKNSLVVSFKRSLSETEAELTGNYTLSNGIGNPLSATINEQESNRVTLFFNQDFQADQDYVLSTERLKDEYEDQLPNASINFRYDVRPPLVLSVNSIYLYQIAVTFNEPLESITAETPNHYLLNNRIQPVSVGLIEGLTETVILTFDARLLNGSSNTLRIKRVKDAYGNEMDSTEVQFVFKTPEKPDFRDIVLNEVYFDTDQTSGLPAQEFIELFNQSDTAFLLTDFFLTDASDTAHLPSLYLQPNEYLILTSRSGEEHYQAFGETTGLSGFPSLSNLGETLWLLDRDMTIVDSLKYSKTSYNDTARNDGGYSIELINPIKPCFDVLNFAASQAEIGGTPGKQNSLFDNSPDLIRPQISSFQVVSQTQLTLSFNEGIDLSTLDREKFQISYNNPVTGIIGVSDFGMDMTLTLTEPFINGELHSLAVTGIRDCSGNLLADTTMTFSRGIEPRAGDLVITEIMAAPSPSQGLPETEYLELLNTSEKIISLENISLADAINATTLRNYDLKPNEYIVLVPIANTYLLSPFGNVLGVENWPSLNNAGDKVSLYNPSGNEIITVAYDDSWYRSSTKAEGGFSLEIIDPLFPCLLESNWNASGSSTGGSPAQVNSVNANNADLISPKVLSAISVNPSTIQLDFSEKMDVSTIAVDNFTSNNGLSFIAVTVLEDEKSVLLTTTTDLMENMVYSIQADNLTDCSGNLIDPNAKSVDLIVAGIVEPLDIIVNEILFNPKSGGVRFIEVYNQSEKYLNLKDWRLGGASNQKVISEENLFVEPRSFHVITNDATILAAHYPTARLDKVIIQNTLPSFPSDLGSVFLLDANDIEIDRLDYSEDYHAPLLTNYDGVSLERIKFSGKSNDRNNWFSAASSNGYATPGYENSQAISNTSGNQILEINPLTFAPDAPSANNFTTINYAFDTSGNVIDLKILSADGKLIRHIAQNTLVGTEGFFIWDGTNERGSKARIGYYMVLCEVISTNGQVSHLVERVAIGGRLNR